MTKDEFKAWATAWELDADGWCPAADLYENQKLIAALPYLLDAAETSLKQLVLRDGTPGWAISKGLLTAAVRKARGPRHE